MYMGCVNQRPLTACCGLNSIEPDRIDRHNEHNRYVPWYTTCTLSHGGFFPNTRKVVPGMKYLAVCCYCCVSYYQYDLSVRHVFVAQSVFRYYY